MRRPTTWRRDQGARGMWGSYDDQARLKAVHEVSTRRDAQARCRPIRPNGEPTIHCREAYEDVRWVVKKVESRQGDVCDGELWVESTSLISKVQ